MSVATARCGRLVFATETPKQETTQMKTQYEKDAQLGRTIRVVLLYVVGCGIGGIMITYGLDAYFKLLHVGFTNYGYAGLIGLLIGTFIMLGIAMAIIEKVQHSLSLMKIGEYALAERNERALAEQNERAK
jgi:hypothetical protein